MKLHDPRVIGREDGGVDVGGVNGLARAEGDVGAGASSEVDEWIEKHGLRLSVFSQLGKIAAILSPALTGGLLEVISAI